MIRDPPRSVFSPTEANFAGNLADASEDDAGPSTSPTPSPIRRKTFTPLRAVRKKPIDTSIAKKQIGPAGGSELKRQLVLDDDDDPVEEEDIENSDDLKDATFGKKVNRKRPHTGKRRPWSEKELEALEKGIKQFGTSWAQIEAHFGSKMPGRNQVDMKDKARTERRKRQKLGLDDGVWGGSSSGVGE